MTDSAIKYVGVDGCGCGWIGIGLADDGCPKVAVCEEFADLVACFGDACVILVDIPIGLPHIKHNVICNKRRSPCEEIARTCDKEARACLGSPRSSSVFSTPPKPFIKKVMNNPGWRHPDAYDEANKWLKKQLRCGRGITRQAFNITPKIGEVDEYMRKRGADSPTIQESHPEVCFWALNGGTHGSAMATGKKTALGFWERFKVLRRHVRNVDTILDVFTEVRRRGYKKSKVADDDILDALALAITAKIVSRNPDRLGTLPDKPPTDNSKKKLPMEMVYALPNDKGTPC